MIKAILIDDEADALEVLEWSLKQHCPEVAVLAMCGSAAEGIAAIKAQQPELVFLDIEMPERNGFDVLHAFPEPQFSVIFTTAYNQYAIKAIRFAAFDYLVKPIDAADLKDAVARFERRGGQQMQAQFQKLLAQLRPEAPQPAGRIALHTAEGLNMVQPEEIVHCAAVSNYTRIFLSNDKTPVVVSKSLREVEDILGDAHFYRVHNSHLVNIAHVRRYVRGDGGFAVMSNGEEIAIARNRKDGFMERFARL